MSNYTKFKNIIENKGGKMISKKFVNYKTKLKYRCKYGHLNKKLPGGIERYQICNQCSKDSEKQKRYDYYKKIIEAHGGTIVSTEYINATTPIKVQCENGHTLRKRASRFVKEIKCKECRKLKQNTEKYEYYKGLVEKNGGKMISTKYANHNTQLEFYCKNKHHNKKLPEKIKAGKKCYKCHYKEKYNDEYYNNEYNKLKNLLRIKVGYCYQKNIQGIRLK